MTARRVHVEISGVVQGVGFRPAVFRLATGLGLSGQVGNTEGGVTVSLQGQADAVGRAVEGITNLRLPGMRIERADVRDEQVQPGLTGFAIGPTARTTAGTEVPADRATCARCLADLLTGASGPDLEYYPLVACTGCGPRLTVIAGMPYQRAATAMRDFPRCPRCTDTYDRPDDRRFTFETHSCWRCGPWFGLLHRATATVDALGAPSELENSLVRQGWRVGLRAGRDRAGVSVLLARVTETLAAGGIVAVKGVGGYQILADAANETAVRRLRRGKRRGAKPFAVMVPSAADAARHCRLGEADLDLLASPAAPVVVLPARGEPLAPSVAMGRATLGVLLPYSPLHHLLVDRPLVVTSGNVSDEPIVHTDRAAVERLAAVADRVLLHDRDIVAPADDSVVRAGDGRPPAPIRRARGYAPDALRLPVSGPAVLAVGGDLKGCFALTRGDRAYLSPHVGDLAHPANAERFGEYLGHLAGLLDLAHEAVACDLHPGYASGRLAADLAGRAGVPLLRVQHHHAHALSVMAEHGLTRAVAVVCDGTGYGPDGTVWGCEVLDARPLGFRRMAHSQEYPLIGGDAAVREPYRQVAAVEDTLDARFRERFGTGFLDSRIGRRVLAGTPYGRRRTLLRQLAERRVNTVACSSAGRLFDLAAVLVLGRGESRYEADLAMALEEEAVRAVPDAGVVRDLLVGGVRDPSARPLGELLGWAWHAGRHRRLPTVELLAGVAAAAEAEEDPAPAAFAFHAGLAAMLAASAATHAARLGVTACVLGGGCFQNTLLLDMVETLLRDAGPRPYRNGLVPANDGGLCLGQAYHAVSRANRDLPQGGRR